MWACNDGGRARIGFKGTNGDCVTRAIAIATEMPYDLVYRMVDLASLEESPSNPKDRSSSQTGVYKETSSALLEALGWTWVRTSRVCLNADELPGGRLIVSLVNHFTAMVDGVIHDIYDPSEDGFRVVLGFWKKV